MLCSGGGDTSGCLRANTPPHLPVTQLRLCLASYHISGAAVPGGALGWRFLDAELLTAFLSPFSKVLWKSCPSWNIRTGGHSCIHGKRAYTENQGQRWRQDSSLHKCCSSIKEMSWWELIPALEETLKVSKMILIHAVHPNHPLPRDQPVGEC